MNSCKSIYIHIPFCKNICHYCDFCKMFYNEKMVDNYLKELEKEIKNNYKDEIIKTIYIGGGTPSCLNYNQLNKLFEIIEIIKKDNLIEFTFECNIEDINEKILKYLYKKGVNRLSIGIQSFNKNNLKYLGRNINTDMINNIKLAKKYFNINIDLIYALKNQTITDLNKDLDIILNLDADHISTYSLIIEKNTKLYINNEENIDEELDFEMYQLIKNKLNDYHHYEISNFSKYGKESKHNLTYWNNNEYYGFGLGASGYLNNTRYENTRSINNYLKGNYRISSNKLSINEIIENEFILGLRKIDGINKQEFYNKYKININEIELIKSLINEERIIDDGNFVKINEQYIYISNEILMKFLGYDYQNMIK